MVTLPAGVKLIKKIELVAESTSCEFKLVPCASVDHPEEDVREILKWKGPTQPPKTGIEIIYKNKITKIFLVVHFFFFKKVNSKQNSATGAEL